MLAGCSNSSGGGGGSNPGVYIAGYYSNGTRKIACYWKDGAKTDLTDPGPTDSNGEAEAQAIFVDGENIYVAGFYKDDSGGQYVASYWKNGSITDLTDGSTDAKAYALYVVSGPDVYVAGYYNSGAKRQAAYWVNSSGNLNNLDDDGAGNHSEARAIFVAGDVYTAGYYFDAARNQPAYWTGTSRTILPVGGGGNFGEARDVAVLGGTVYVSGQYTDFGSGQVRAVYWISGVKQPDLPTSSYPALAFSIFTEGGSIYVAGRYGVPFMPTQWQDGTREDLPFDTNGTARSAYVSDGDVHVAGDNQPGGVFDAVYWRNGVKTNLTPAISGDSQAYSIYVVP